MDYTETSTSRERVLKAVNHQQPDRIPIDLGGFQTGIHRKAYEDLIEHLVGQIEHGLLGVTPEGIACLQRPVGTDGVVPRAIVHGFLGALVQLLRRAVFEFVAVLTATTQHQCNAQQPQQGDPGRDSGIGKTLAEFRKWVHWRNQADDRVNAKAK